MGIEKIDYVSLQDYLQIERNTSTKYEYHEGQLFAMAGGTIAHTLISGNAHAELRDASAALGSCVAFNSEMKIELRPKGKYVYPDAGLACPTLDESEHLTGAITNPCVIVEVTSRDSGDYDRGQKMLNYFALPSVQEYVLVDQEEPFVTVYRRRGDLMRIDQYRGLEATISVEALNRSISMKQLYRDVTFPPKKDEE